MKYTILILSVFFFSLQTMAAQKSESSSFKDKTWYGAHVNLGFQASSFRSDLSLGLSPMMGYRVLDFLSVGPRASLLYQRIGFSDGVNGNEKFTFWDKGVGAFLRAEVYRQYFIQGELMYESIEDFNGFKANGMNAYVGIGMNSGGQNPSVDLMLMYDLNLQSLRKGSLINARFGFTLYY